MCIFLPPNISIIIINSCEYTHTYTHTICKAYLHDCSTLCVLYYVRINICIGRPRTRLMPRE